IKRFFDLVLVHGDPDLIPFHETFPSAHEIAGHIAYTGYVAGPPAHPSATRNEVLLSTGGGAVAERLIHIALAARPLSTLTNMPWRVIAGANTSPAQLAAYRRAAPDGVVFEHTRDDFPELLASARLSISQGGYNTVIETLSAGIPALCMPFAEDGESEQTIRCRAVAARGWLHMIEQSDATPQAFAAAIDRAAAARPPPVTLNMDGAATTARCLATALANKQAKSRE
ncbi:MAG: glycosyltransferase, partial [Alphaproteobacteria bacterium]